MPKPGGYNLETIFADCQKHVMFSNYNRLFGWRGQKMKECIQFLIEFFIFLGTCPSRISPFRQTATWIINEVVIKLFSSLSSMRVIYHHLSIFLFVLVYDWSQYSWTILGKFGPPSRQFCIKWRLRCEWAAIQIPTIWPKEKPILEWSIILDQRKPKE